MPVFISQFETDERQSLTSRSNVRVSDGRDQGRVTLQQVFDAGRDEAIYRSNLDAQQERYREAYRRRIAALKPLTGSVVGFTILRNPEDIWDENVQSSRLQGGGFTVMRQRRIFADMLDKLGRDRKDIDPRLTAPIDQDVIDVGLEAGANAADLKDRRSYQSALNNVDTATAALIGGFVGSLKDPTSLPQFIAGILSGGTSLVGKSVAQQALITGAREATAGAVLEASFQGVRKTNEEALGQEYGVREVAQAIGGAAVGGALIGGAGEVVGAGVRKLITGRALPMNDPVVIEPARLNAVPDNQPAMPDGLARMINAPEPDARLAAPEAFMSDNGGVGIPPSQAVPAVPDNMPDNGVRPFGFVPPDSERLVDWEKAFDDSGGVIPPEMRAALGVIEAENASVAASRATPAPYRVPDADAVRAIEKAYTALEMGEPLPAPALPRRYADLPEGADASMPMHPDEALAAAAMYRSTGELPALAAGDPVLLDQIEALGRLSNATFDQVNRGDLTDDVGAVIGELAWNRPDTHQELSAMLIDDDVSNVLVARDMVSTRLEELTPDVSGALLGVRALPVLPAIDLAKVQPMKLADALRRAAPALPRSLDDLDVMTPLESTRAFAEAHAQEQLREAAAIAKRKPDPDMLDGDWKERVASMRTGALRDLAILDKGGLPESGYQALDDVMRARGKAVAPKRRARPVEVGNDAAVQQGKDAAAAGGVGDGARIKAAQKAVDRTNVVGVSVSRVGPHGPIVEGLSGQWAKARDVLASIQDGDVIGVLTLPDGYGAADVIFGNANRGLAKIMAKHPEVLPDLDKRLARMNFESVQGNNRVYATPDGLERAVFTHDQTANGTTKVWLLTAYERSGERSGLSIGGREPVQGLARSPNQPLTDQLPPSPPKINDSATDLGENASFDFIDMVMDPDGLAGDVDNPGAMTQRDAAKVAARDDFMVERFRGCIL